MKKTFYTIAALAAFSVAAMAGTSREVTITIPAGATAGTNTIRMIRGGSAIQRITGVQTAATNGNTTVVFESIEGGAGLLQFGGQTLTNTAQSVAYPRTVTKEAFTVQDVRITATLGGANDVPVTATFFIQSR